MARSAPTSVQHPQPSTARTQPDSCATSGCSPLADTGNAFAGTSDRHEWTAPPPGVGFSAGGEVTVRQAVWALVWSAHAGFAVGAWDEAAAEADRSVSLLQESGHEWLGPLTRCAAVLVPAARGQWATADGHAQEALARPGDYELMVVAAALAKARVAAARSDHEAVLRSMKPVLLVDPQDGLDEPGLWLWQGLYADALVSTGRLTEADEFLQPLETVAMSRGSGSVVSQLARVRGRLETSRGQPSAAESAFQLGLAELGQMPMPFPRALLELAYGQMLRRAGQRRAAAQQLHAARLRLIALRANPYLERCELELAACGLAPAKRRNFDPSRLTAQESAVAHLVARGLGNRQVASELFVSIKTVQFHLTHIYAKLGIRTRTELAARLGADATAPPLSQVREQKGVKRQLQPGAVGSRSLIAKRTDVDRSLLTPQELAVARLVALGMGNRQVAGRLFISIKTVQFHLTHIYAKLGISTRAELAAQFCDADTESPPPLRGNLRERFAGRATIERFAGALSPAGSSPATPGARTLTRQELAVAKLVAMGRTNRQIAAELFVGITTVQLHLTHIYTKLGFRSRTELTSGFRPNYHH